MKRGPDSRVPTLFFISELRKILRMEPVMIHTLGNGLRIAAQRSDGNVAYIGVLVNAGSRDDKEGRDGLAHFVEHTIFKGTPKRSSWHVSNRMEMIGGELNAYTTKEEIMLYTNAPAGYEERAIELLADLVRNASFPAAEIERERSVITEEIFSYHDNAAYAVFDEFDELFFKGSSLAHNILGYEDSVSKISGTDCRAFLTSYFSPGNMVIYCVTPTPTAKCLRLIEKHFGSLSRPMPALGRSIPNVAPRFDECKKRDNHQANVVIGCPIFSQNDPRRYALYLFSNILGGSAMNSRLNQELRERRGLVYTVESSVSLYSDTGAFQVYFGTEAKKIERCTALIRREIEKMASTPMSDRAFAQARRQLCGQLLVSGENRENCAMTLAKSLMRHGEIHDQLHTSGMIMETTKDELMQVAGLIADSEFSRLTLT